MLHSSKDNEWQEKEKRLCFYTYIYIFYLVIKSNVLASMRILYWQIWLFKKFLPYSFQLWNYDCEFLKLFEAPTEIILALSNHFLLAQLLRSQTVAKVSVFQCSAPVFSFTYPQPVIQQSDPSGKDSVGLGKQTGRTPPTKSSSKVIKVSSLSWLWNHIFPFFPHPRLWL